MDDEGPGRLPGAFFALLSVFVYGTVLIGVIVVTITDMLYFCVVKFHLYTRQFANSPVGFHGNWGNVLHAEFGTSGHVVSSLLLYELFSLQAKN
jgi:hypothetical protein